jgi:hypothetical protein
VRITLVLFSFCGPLKISSGYYKNIVWDGVQTPRLEANNAFTAYYPLWAL